MYVEFTQKKGFSGDENRGGKFNFQNWEDNVRLCAKDVR